jgi:type II secretory pathway pseudopilin PulG
MQIRKRSGQTLIEVTMATMIAAITTTAVFSVVLSSYVSNSKADKRDAAAMALKYAQDTLKSYVSAEPGSAAYSPSNAGLNPGLWSKDTSGGLALRAGDHDISSLVSGPPLSTPGNPATFSYKVTNEDCLGIGGGAPDAYQCKKVVFSLKYTD